MIGPDRQLLIAESRISRRRAEEKYVLLCRRHPMSDGLREQLSQPWPAGKNETVRFESRAVRQRQTLESGALSSPSGPNCDLPILAPTRHECVDYRLAAGSRLEISALRLEYAPLDIFEVDLRPALLHLGSGQLLIFDLGRAQHLYRSALKDVIAFRSHPQNAGAVQELLLPLPLVFRPQEECARRHCGIWLVGPVSPAHDARLSARRRSRISRSPGIEQRDLRAALEQDARQSIRRKLRLPRPRYEVWLSLEEIEDTSSCSFKIPRSQNACAPPRKLHNRSATDLRSASAKPSTRGTSRRSTLERRYQLGSKPKLLHLK